MINSDPFDTKVSERTWNTVIRCHLDKTPVTLRQ